MGKSTRKPSQRRQARKGLFFKVIDRKINACLNQNRTRPCRTHNLRNLKLSIKDRFPITLHTLSFLPLRALRLCESIKYSFNFCFDNHIQGNQACHTFTTPAYIVC